MADAVANLLAALDRADLCRVGSPMQAVCDPCWSAVYDAVVAVKATRTPDKPVQVPVD